MTREINIKQDKCSVDKRMLHLEFELRGKNYVFHYDGWNEPYPKYYEMDGSKMNFTLLS